MINIQVARDFSRHPAGRFEKDGPYSGEFFRKKFLVPYLRRGEAIVVEMDGARGYGSSFLEEAFGGLIREGFPLALVQEKLRIVSSNPSIEPEIDGYLVSAWRTAQATNESNPTHH
ncbi:STAS-like domain-containing protein [Burkholderia gladioli]|uniref:STAS-like domain-containing protein n=1 Tax=Burkholderia gladioli TaxID=28095 RepID=UPI00163FEBF5|nr:STAS-like domain-containing protein [Burkholderia gladioli]